ncbi:MAG: HlyD family type I secretion periplasmic adaptor subunit [Desulfovibrio sp.]|jgi:adhesin transport system membrane fusion protein|nr:HlyD family type I secretion periplasmic adaptor subunit [Desulfovibrio sp.]
MGFFRNRRPAPDPLDLQFMSEVEAAMRFKGGRWAYVLSTTLFCAFFVILFLIATTDRNEVTRGEGQITPSLGVQPIQSEQGGIIKEIFVLEGQEVKKGDRLVQMSNIEAVSEYQDLMNKQAECVLSLKRLEAEAAGTPLVYTEEETAAHREMVGDQLRLYAARKEKLLSGTRELEAGIQQKRASVAEAMSRKSQYEQNLILLKEQVERVRPLVQQRVYSEVEYLNLRQRVISQEGDLHSLAETISRTQSEVREEEARLANRDSEWQAAIAAENNTYRRQLDSINQKSAAGSHRVNVSELRAPMNGVIRRILLKEENVVQRAQAIMELLPTDDALEVDARFKPADRGYLEVGMTATVQVDAYDSTVYGGLPASVTRISADTIEDSRGQAWYEVRLQTESSRLRHGDQSLDIKPGMTVKVDVISGEKSIFDYLMKPILKSRQKGTARSTADERAGAPPARTDDAAGRAASPSEPGGARAGQKPAVPGKARGDNPA